MSKAPYSTPNSMVGLSYGILSTLFLLLAAVLYFLRRRMRKRVIGQLHASLNWYMFFAIIGLTFVLMHSFGHFNPISGTYALGGMLALTVSGIVGRILDRFMPRLITAQVSKVLTVQGEDRITTISQKLQALTRPGTAIPGVQEHISALQDVHNAMLREQWYRSLNESSLSFVCLIAWTVCCICCHKFVRYCQPFYCRGWRGTINVQSPFTGATA